MPQFSRIHKMSKHVGMNMRLFRIKYDMDIETISKETGMSKDTLYKVERGVLFGKSFVNYVLYLKNKNADLNQIFDSNDNELLR